MKFSLKFSPSMGARRYFARALLGLVTTFVVLGHIADAGTQICPAQYLSERWVRLSRTCVFISAAVTTSPATHVLGAVHAIVCLPLGGI